MMRTKGSVFNHTRPDRVATSRCDATKAMVLLYEATDENTAILKSLFYNGYTCQQNAAEVVAQQSEASEYLHSKSVSYLPGH